MAKSLGFGPDALVRARPDPKEKWKLPVKYWIHELHFKRFGFVLGEKTLSPTPPAEDEGAARLYEEEIYSEDYCERNQDNRPMPNQRTADPTREAPLIVDEINLEDVPF